MVVEPDRLLDRWDTNWKVFAAILLGFVLLVAQQTLAKRTTPALDLRHGWWLLVWFAGLAIISYLGPYPAVSKGAGNLGVAAFGVGVVLCALLTAIVMALAYTCRLPRRGSPPAHGGGRLRRPRGG